LLQSARSTTDLDAARVSTRTFHDFLFISRQFYFVARPFLYHTIFLTHGKRVRQLYRSIEKSPSLSSHVRHLFFVEQKDWSGLKPKSEAMPQLWQSVKCQRPEVAANWKKTSRAQREVALQLVSILAGVKNLKTFKYCANIDPTQWPVRDRGTIFDWIFMTLISTLASRKYGHGLLHSLEEVDITGLSPPNKATFLRVFFKLPNLRSFSLRPASHLQTLPQYLPDRLSQTIRELRITSPISLNYFPSLLRAVDKLEVLYLDICPSSFEFTSAYTAFKDALKTQHTHLREVHISSRIPCGVHFLGTNNRPWSFWECTNLRILSIPDELYNHYGANITRATHFLIPPHVETLIISHWWFETLEPVDVDFLVQDTAVCLQLQKVVLQDLVGGQHGRMYKFGNARKAFAKRNVALVYEDCAAEGRARAKEKCPWWG
jgi:hypothetical protein